MRRAKATIRLGLTLVCAAGIISLREQRQQDRFGATLWSNGSNFDLLAGNEENRARLQQERLLVRRGNGRVQMVAHTASEARARCSSDEPLMSVHPLLALDVCVRFSLEATRAHRQRNVSSI